MIIYYEPTHCVHRLMHCQYKDSQHVVVIHSVQWGGIQMVCSISYQVFFHFPYQNSSGFFPNGSVSQTIHQGLPEAADKDCDSET